MSFYSNTYCFFSLTRNRSILLPQRLSRWLPALFLIALIYHLSFECIIRICEMQTHSQLTLSDLNGLGCRMHACNWGLVCRNTLVFFIAWQLLHESSRREDCENLWTLLQRKEDYWCIECLWSMLRALLNDAVEGFWIDDRLLSKCTGKRHHRLAVQPRHLAAQPRHLAAHPRHLTGHALI